MKRNEEYCRIVMECYPTMSGAEIEKAFGIKRGTAQKIASRLGIVHTKETEERLMAERIHRLKSAKIDRVKLGKTRRAKRRMDEFRIWNGQERQTNYLFPEIPRRTYMAMYRLVRTYGYEYVESDPYSLKIVETTRRCKKEDYFTGKYGIQFLTSTTTP